MDADMEMTVLTHYERIAEASGRMLGAARASDWDTLCEAERECAALIARLRALGGGQDLSGESQKRRMSAIRKVLADDAEIRRLSQPWLEKLESFLGGRSADHRLRDAYR
jgi:flagellar protein FliT